MGNFITDNMVQTIGENAKVNNKLITSINLSVSELGITFGEQMPNNVIVGETLGYVWNNNFIDKLLYVMATDNEGILNDKEQEAWDNFILYEDGSENESELYSTLDKRFVNIYKEKDTITTRVMYRDLYEIKKNKGKICQSL